MPIAAFGLLLADAVAAFSRLFPPPPFHSMFSAPPTVPHSTAVTPPPAASASPSSAARGPGFVFVGERLWLDFVNSDPAAGGPDALFDFDSLVHWLEAAAIVDPDRAAGMRRRAQQQPAGAAAALSDARRVRDALRPLAERGERDAAVRDDAVSEINRVLGRSAGTRRLELRTDGSFARAFVPGGDAFAGLMIPLVESAADALILGELARVRTCASAACRRVFFDGTKNGGRRWCDMATCGNRAKAARHRARKRH